MTCPKYKVAAVQLTFSSCSETQNFHDLVRQFCMSLVKSYLEVRFAVNLNIGKDIGKHSLYEHSPATAVIAVALAKSFTYISEKME